MKLERTLRVVSALGLHLRAAMQVAVLLRDEADGHEVFFEKEARLVDARKFFQVGVLEVLPGDDVRVTVRGPHAQRVLDQVTRLFNSGFDMDKVTLAIPASHGETKVIEGE